MVSLYSQIENGYFVHHFAPEDLPTMPKNVIFVIDKSGSMSGRKIQQVGFLDHEISNSLTFYGTMGEGFLGSSLVQSINYEPIQDTRKLAHGSHAFREHL